MRAGMFKLPEFGEFQNPLDAIKEGTKKLTASNSRARNPTPTKADTVFVAGASGRLGIRIVYELAAAGYRVRAGVRSQDKADAFDDQLDSLCISLGDELDKKARSNINLVYCDLQDEESIEPAIGNASRVICAVGAAESEFTNLSAPKLIDFEATETLINVAASCKVDQFILVTSLGTGKLGFPAGVLNLFGGILIWKRKAEEALEQSGMRYLIVRPGGMERPTDNHRAMGYNMKLATRDSLFGGTVSRLQIAELIAEAVASPDLASNKCVEVVSELGFPEVSYEDLLRGMPVEVDQEAREAAMGTIQELATKEAGLRSKIEVLSSDLGETRELIAELQGAVAEARTEEKGILKENTEILRAAQRAEAEIEALRVLVEEQKMLAEASKAVAAAQQKGLAAGVILSPQEIASIREAVLYPVEKEEEVNKVTSMVSEKKKGGVSLFGGFSLPGSEPKAVQEEEVEEEEEQVVQEPMTAKSKASDGLFDNLVGFFEGDARRGTEEVKEEVVVEEPKPVPEPTKPEFTKSDEKGGLLGGFRIRNLFGGEEYAFIDDLEEVPVVNQAASLPVVDGESIAATVAEDPVVAAEEPFGAEPAAEPAAERLPAPAKSLFPTIEIKMPTFEFPSVPAMPKVELPSATPNPTLRDVSEVREWIEAWKSRTGAGAQAESSSASTALDGDTSEEVQEVRAWISAWRERTNN